MKTINYKYPLGSRPSLCAEDDRTELLKELTVSGYKYGNYDQWEELFKHFVGDSFYREVKHYVQHLKEQREVSDSMAVHRAQRIVFESLIRRLILVILPKRDSRNISDIFLTYLNKRKSVFHQRLFTVLSGWKTGTSISEARLLWIPPLKERNLNGVVRCIKNIKDVDCEEKNMMSDTEETEELDALEDMSSLEPEDLVDGFWDITLCDSSKKTKGKRHIDNTSVSTPKKARTPKQKSKETYKKSFGKLAVEDEIFKAKSQIAENQKILLQLTQGFCKKVQALMQSNTGIMKKLSDLEKRL